MRAELHAHGKILPVWIAYVLLVIYLLKYIASCRQKKNIPVVCTLQLQALIH